MNVGKSHVSGWLVALVLAWLGLGTRMILAIVRHESLSGDLALPAFAFFVASVLVLSRAFALVLHHPHPSSS